MMEFLTPIIVNLVRIIIAGCFAYLCKSVIPAVIPWLKQVGMYHVVKYFVNAAEKMASTSQIPKETKKQWVKNMLNNVGIKDSVIIDALIEGAVEELDNQKGKVGDAFNK